MHFADIEKLLDILQKLTDAGNTVIVIEHNLDVIHSADWVIDLGPEGGNEGGYIIANGPPEKIMNFIGGGFIFIISTPYLLYTDKKNCNIFSKLGYI